MIKQEILDKLKITPRSSGVYIMYNTADHVIYVGKAKDLQSRLSSYFINKKHNDKTAALVSNIDRFDYFVTKTERDALALECNLIKRHKPHYNVLLKDNKSFAYLKINVKEPFASLEITRKVKKDGAKYFGPYFAGVRASVLLDIIADVFNIRLCEGKLKQKQVPCVNYQIGRCKAPCCGKISQEEYCKEVEKVKDFLNGKGVGAAREKLVANMQNASNLQQFEIAIKLRESLKNLDMIAEKNIAIKATDLNADVFGMHSAGDLTVVSVLIVRGGLLIGCQNHVINSDAVGDVLEQFMLQYYSASEQPEVIVSEKDAPQRGHRRQLLDMANANAKEYLEKQCEQLEFKQKFTLGACSELAQILSVETPLKRIECYDISNTGGEDNVASMVVFTNGVADKAEYRRFKVRHEQGANDFLSMRETLLRRHARTEWDKPDLVVIDGGKGQLSAVADIGFKMIAFSENDEIFTPELIALPKRSLALRLLQRIRDEAHRFAITYHKKLRSKKFIKR